MVEMRRRFSKLRHEVVDLVGTKDVFGLNTSKPLAFNVEAQAWRFQTDSQKITSFNKWFQNQINEDILAVDIKGDPWTAKYVDSAYKKGSIRAYTDVHKASLAESPDFYNGSKAQFLKSAFSQPERLSKLRFLYTRSYEDLKGISNAMSQQISRVLADGLSQGVGPATMASRMTKTISGITKKRALVMARTEVIAAHAEGQLDSFEDLGVKEIGAMAEWSTAGDDRVCPLCAELEGTVMTVEEARGLIPRHPNCRCAWIPANVGETEKKKRYWSKEAKQIQIDKSLKAELPKKTRAGEKVPQTVAEARKRSTWVGRALRPKTAKKLGTTPSKPIPKPVPKPVPKQKVYKQFSETEASQYSQEISKSFEKTLTTREWVAIQDYTSLEYRNVNKAAREGISALPLSVDRPKMTALMKNLDEGIGKAKISENITVYRASMDENIAKIIDSGKGGSLKGTIMTDKGYMSTSLKRKAIEGYVDEGRGGVLLEIRVPKGAPGGGVEAISLHKKETEILFARGRKLKIISTEIQKTGNNFGNTRLVVAEMIL